MLNEVQELIQVHKLSNWVIDIIGILTWFGNHGDYTFNHYVILLLLHTLGPLRS